MSSLRQTAVCVLVGVIRLKLHQTDTRQTYQLGQFTGCLRSHRPIITKENIKLHPSHCLCSAIHEVILCLTWPSQLGKRSEKWAGWCAGGSHPEICVAWLATWPSQLPPGPWYTWATEQVNCAKKEPKMAGRMPHVVPPDKCSSFQCNRCLMLFDLILVLFLLFLGQLLRRF